MNYLTTDTELTSVANAIRTKGGTSENLVYPSGFVTAIGEISTGTDVSDTTAIAGDVLNTKYFYTAAGVKTQGSMATGSATTPSTTIQVTPALLLDGSTGVVTAYAFKTQAVTPTVSAGYIASGTSGNIYVDGSGTLTIPSWTGGTYGAPLYAFTVVYEEYNAEAGMTWAEWIESAYNTNNYTNNGTYIYNGSLVVGLNGSYVSPSDYIINSEEYGLLPPTPSPPPPSPPPSSPS